MTKTGWGMSGFVLIFFGLIVNIIAADNNFRKGFPVLPGTILVIVGTVMVTQMVLNQ